MSFDLGNVVNKAKQVASNSEGGGDSKEYKYRLLYPGIGSVYVKLLFNPKSSLAIRLVNQHSINNEKHVCLRSYGQDCPICKAVDSLNNSTGKDHYSLKSKSRGIAFAQYLGCSKDYQWSENYPEPKIGEIVILMFPWTIYQDLNRIIAEAGQYADQILTTNSTKKLIELSHYIESKQHKYKAQIISFGALAEQGYTSCPSDAEYEKMLMDLDPLTEQVIPSTITPEIISDANKVANELLSGLNVDRSPQVASNQTTQINTQEIPFTMSAPQQVMDTPQNSNKPACYGSHKDGVRECLVCPLEFNCIQATKSIVQ